MHIQKYSSEIKNPNSTGGYTQKYEITQDSKTMRQLVIDANVVCRKEGLTLISVEYVRGMNSTCSYWQYVIRVEGPIDESYKQTTSNFIYEELQKRGWPKEVNIKIT